MNTDVAENIISPRTIPGSVLSSLAVHGLMIFATVALMHTGFFQKTATYEEVTLDYEVLNDVPQPNDKQRPMARTRPVETPVQNPVKDKSASQELQDTKSDVVGTQAAAKVESAPQAPGEGSAPATPYYKIKPKYPQAALVSGYEGWVLMKIDVNEHGEVENVRVIDGERRNLFQDEARRAIAKWKYKPFLDGKGNPIRKADHEVRVDFKLQDA